jgi:hypothetical protein
MSALPLVPTSAPRELSRLEKAFDQPLSQVDGWGRLPVPGLRSAQSLRLFGDPA